MKNRNYLIIIFSLSFLSVFSQNNENDESSRLDALNNYWSEVTRAVNEGDFEAYVMTCHPKGVLVAGIGEKTYPLSRCIEAMEKGFCRHKIWNKRIFS